MKKALVLLLAVTGYYGYAQNQQPINLDSVTIDTKTRIPKKNSGKITTVITTEMLKNQQGSSVADVINTVAGIEINGNLSNDGQNLSYIVRGGNNRQVLIMVDGVALNDASQIANDYDLRLLPVTDVASIEIMKGASSVLYGSGAAAAVININTKKASDKPVSASFSTILGSNRSTENNEYDLAQFTNAVGVDGSLGKFIYDLDFSHRYTDGLSAVAAPEGSPLLNSDKFNRFNTRINLGYKISENIKFNQFFAYDKFKAGFDEFDFTDAENSSISEQLRTGGHFEWKYSKGMYNFNDSYTVIKRDIESGFPSKFDSRAYAFDTYINHQLIPKLNAVLGLNANFSNFESFAIPFGAAEFEEQVNRDDARFNIIDPYLNLVYQSGFGLNLNAGARLNIHSEYGTNAVYNLNPSYVFEIGNYDLKVLSSYSTAYITPSLFQLYDPQFGNAELDPEENRTIEVGLSIINSKTFNISVLYFDRLEENFVDFVNVDPDNFIFQYRNLTDEFEASGVEIEVAFSGLERLMFNANYTNTQRDERFALRVPEHKANAYASYSIKPSTSVGLNYQFVGERTDRFFNPDTFESEDVLLSEYSLIGLTFASKLTENVSVFAEVFNLFDEEYEELFRFQTRGRNVRLGFTLDF